MRNGKEDTIHNLRFVEGPRLYCPNDNTRLEYRAEVDMYRCSTCKQYHGVEFGKAVLVRTKPSSRVRKILGKKA